MNRNDRGAALVDVVVWMTVWGVLGLVLLAIVRSPAPAAQLNYAVSAAAEAAARERDAAGAEAAALEELEVNLSGPGNPHVCAEAEPRVDASRLSPVLRDDALPEPGLVDVFVACTVTARTLAGASLDLSTTVVAHGRHVADVYRRSE